MVNLSALSIVLAAERRWTTVVAEDHASKLHLAVLAELLRQKNPLKRRGRVRSHWLSPCVRSMQILEVPEVGA